MAYYDIASNISRPLTDGRDRLLPIVAFAASPPATRVRGGYASPTAAAAATPDPPWTNGGRGGDGAPYVAKGAAAAAAGLGLGAGPYTV